MRLHGHSDGGSMAINNNDGDENEEIVLTASDDDNDVFFRCSSWGCFPPITRFSMRRKKNIKQLVSSVLPILYLRSQCQFLFTE